MDPNDPEVKVSTLATQSEESFPDYLETARLDRFSNWFKVRRAVAVCLRFKRLLKERRIQKPTEAQSSMPVEDSASSYQPVDMGDIGHAEMAIIRCVQHSISRKKSRLCQRSKRTVNLLIEGEPSSAILTLRSVAVFTA